MTLDSLQLHGFRIFGQAALERSRKGLAAVPDPGSSRSLAEVSRTDAIIVAGLVIDSSLLSLTRAVSDSRCSFDGLSLRWLDSLLPLPGLLLSCFGPVILLTALDLCLGSYWPLA